MEIHADEVEAGCTLVHNKDGLKGTRVFKVTNVEASNVPARIGLAISAYGVPRKNEPHPGVGGLIVSQVSARLIPNTTDAFYVEVEYATPDRSNGSGDEPSEASPPRISLGGSMQATATNHDIHQPNDPVRLSHTFIYRDENGREVKRKVVKDQTVEIDVQVPVLVLRLDRKEPVMPFQKKLRFQGKTNKNAIWGGDQHSWLCTDISGSSPNGGLSYDVTYEFQMIPGRTWDPTVICVDTETGQIAIDPIDGQGKRVVQVYEDDDFSELNLNFDGPQAVQPQTNQITLVGQ